MEVVVLRMLRMICPLTDTYLDLHFSAHVPDMKLTGIINASQSEPTFHSSSRANE